MRAVQALRAGEGLSVTTYAMWWIKAAMQE